MSNPQPDVARPRNPGGHSNSYDIFILVLTVLSLVIMVLLILPLAPQELELLSVYDNAICIVFLLDFALNMSRAHPKSDYFIGRRGWLDLIGSIPSFGVFRFGGLLRLARLSRLARVTRLLRGENQKRLVEDIVRNRGEYAVFITLLAAFMVLVTASLLVLQFESSSSDANIVTGGDALWWALVTITTVGYGDFFPVTFLGRVTGVFVMFAGVGIIGALASILASILVPQPKENAEAATSDRGANGPLLDELTSMRAELAALREAVTAERAG